MAEDMLIILYLYNVIAKNGMVMHMNKKSGMANAIPAIPLLPPLTMNNHVHILVINIIHIFT